MKILGLEIRKSPPKTTFEVSKLSRVSLEPDDVLVLHCNERLSREAGEVIQAELKSLFGEKRDVLVMDRGLRLTIVTNNASENAVSD